MVDWCMETVAVFPEDTVPGPGGCLLWAVWSWGVWSLGGCLLQGGPAPGGPGGDPPTANTAGGTHPTGMHSCLKIRPFCFPTFFVCLNVKCSQTAALNKNAFQ